MTPAIMILIGILATVGLALFALNLLTKVFKNYKPGRNQVKKDLAKAKAEIAPYKADLVKWNEEELQLLSLNHTNKVIKKGMAPEVKGVITSIFHEPVIAYNYKRYVGKKENALLYATTSDREYFFHVKDGDTHIYMDDQWISTLSDQGTLHRPNDRQVLGQVTQSTQDAAMPVLLSGREVASLLDPARADHVNPRAFQYVDQGLPKEEEDLLLSLAILGMVRNEVPK